MSLERESEFKFVSLGNLQLKFSPVESGETVAEKVIVLCGLLGIGVSRRRSEDVTDEYFDDDHFNLLTNDCSLRRRTKGEKSSGTFKRADPKDPSEALHRIEVEVSGEQFAQLVNDNSAFHEFLTGQAPDVELSSDLKQFLTVHNHRTKLILRTSAAEYEFSYDKFYYFNPRNGRYSEYFSEIEIELLGDEMPSDSQLEQLRGAVPILLNSKVSRRSKAETGEEWLRRNESARPIFTVAFDIVAYSQRTADVQKQLIMKFNKLTKEALWHIRGQSSPVDVIYLPTGDGMILIFEDRPETLLPFIFSLQQKVRAHQENPFSFRTGLHLGPVFQYSDVNENLNVAGSGINLAVRAMSTGDDWHIIATEAAFESLGQTDAELNNVFHPIGKYTVKHGLTLNLFNIYDRDRNC